MTDFSTRGKHDAELLQIARAVRKELSRRNRYRNLILEHEFAIRNGHSVHKIKKAAVLAARARQYLREEGVS